MKSLQILFLVALGLLSCSKDDDNSSSASTASFNVTYKISCSDCYVIWEENGVQKNQEHVNSTWTKSFPGTKNSQVLLVAMNTSNVPQGVGATILLNGDTLQSQTNYCPISGTVMVLDTLR